MAVKGAPRVENRASRLLKGLTPRVGQMRGPSMPFRRLRSMDQEAPAATRPARTSGADARETTGEEPSFAASPQSAPLHGACYLDDDLLDTDSAAEPSSMKTRRITYHL